MSQHCLEVYDSHSQLVTRHPLEVGAHHRIGGDAACNVCIEGLPPHALTLREVGGVFMVINRLDRSMFIGDLELQPRHSLEWPVDGPILKVGSVGLRLCRRAMEKPVRPKLVHDGWADVPAEVPVEDPFYFGRIESRAGEGAIAPPPERRKQLQLLQIAVIFGVLAVLVYYTFFVDGSEAGQGTKPVSIAAALGATDAVFGDQPLKSEIRGRLQDAYAASVRGDLETAKHLLIAVRDRLPTSPAEDLDGKQLDTLRRYVLQTLAATEREAAVASPQD